MSWVLLSSVWIRSLMFPTNILFLILERKISFSNNPWNIPSFPCKIIFPILHFHSFCVASDRFHSNVGIFIMPWQLVAQLDLCTGSHCYVPQRNLKETYQQSVTEWHTLGKHLPSLSSLLQICLSLKQEDLIPLRNVWLCFIVIVSCASLLTVYSEERSDFTESLTFYCFLFPLVSFNLFWNVYFSSFEWQILPHSFSFSFASSLLRKCLH